MSRSSHVASHRLGVAVVAATALVLPVATAGSAAAATTGSSTHRSPAVRSVAANQALKSALAGRKTAGSAHAARQAGTAEPGFQRSQFPAKGQVAVMIQLQGTPAALAFAAAKSSGAAAAHSAGANAASGIAQESAAVQHHFSAPATAAHTLFTVHNLYAGIAVRTDVSKLAALAALPGVIGVHLLPSYHTTNSSTVPLVGAPSVWSGVSGQIGKGVKVGIIDTGVDYTHAMFGGTGNSRAYDADHAVADSSTLSVPSGDFPSAKVVGGVDLVGDDYQADPNSDNFQPVPHQDPNPLDCNSHGSHVAGSAAGYGVTTAGATYGLTNGSADLAKYSGLGALTSDQYAGTFRIGPGVAPGASVYAIKVFGCEGSTNVVAQALDWSADPNGDGNYDDHLDVVNMSLGSDYEQPDSADAVASNNASLLGITVVAAAGNGGDLQGIAGTPAGASRAISVAASDDASTVYDALQENSPVSQQIPGQRSIAYDWAHSGPTTADVVAVNPDYIAGQDPATGNADGCSDFSPSQQAAVNGKIAWVEWTDVDANRACGSAGRSAKAVAAGAVGVIIADDANSFAAGITGSGVVPVFEIRSSDAGTMRAAAQGKAGLPLNVTLTNDLATSTTIVDPSTVDQVAGFSSRGWGSDDTIKPDLAAPGVSVFSTGMGTGNEGQSDSGTSMATPHTAGMAALVKAAHPSWYPEQVKAALMNTAATSVVRDTAACSKTSLSFSPGACTEAPDRVGAGRTQVDRAVATQTLAYEFSRDGSVGVSFGHPQVSATQTLTRLVKVQNDSDSDQTYDVSYTPSNDGTAPAGVTFSTPSTVTVTAHHLVTMSVTMTVDPALLSRPRDLTHDASAFGLPTAYVPEAAGILHLSQGGNEQLRLPVYAAPKATSTVHAASPTAAFSALGDDVTRPTVDFSSMSLTGTSFSTADYQSLTGGFELGATSPQKPACSSGATDFTTCTPAPSDAAGDVLSVGATSDSGLVPDSVSLTYFAVHSAAPWQTPASFMENDILIDANGDGDPDAVLYNTRLPDTDVMVAELDSLDGDTLDIELLNGVAGSTDSNAFDNDTMVLPALTSAIESLTGDDSDGSISYTVEAYTEDTGLSDTTSPASFNPTRPGLGIDDGNDASNAYNDSFSYYPLWWQAGAGDSLEVFRDKEQLGADGVHQLMLVNLNNAKGSTVDLVDVIDPTTTAVSVLPSPSVFGQAATATATVSPVGGSTVLPTGALTLSIDGHPYQTHPLADDGTASFALPAALHAGSHTIAAAYAGDAVDSPSQGSTPLTVNKASTSTSVALSPASPAYGQVSKASVTVTSAASAVEAITGTVSILEGTTVRATGAVHAGHALITLPQLIVGAHNLHATFSGTPDYLASASPIVRLTVKKATSRTTLTSSSTSVRAGATVTLKAVTAVVAPGASALNGTVTFFDGTTNLGTYATHGSVSRSAVRLGRGSHHFRAVYNGSPTVSPSAGAVTVTVT